MTLRMMLSRFCFVLSLGFALLGVVRMAHASSLDCEWKLQGDVIGGVSFWHDGGGCPAVTCNPATPPNTCEEAILVIGLTKKFCTCADGTDPLCIKWFDGPANGDGQGGCKKDLCTHECVASIPPGSGWRNVTCTCP